VRLEKQSFSAYNEAEFLKDVIERYRQHTGHYPERVLADKIIRTLAAGFMEAEKSFRRIKGYRQFP
jgi:hypothetical protein